MLGAKQERQDCLFLSYETKFARAEQSRRTRCVASCCLRLPYSLFYGRIKETRPPLQHDVKFIVEMKASEHLRPSSSGNAKHYCNAFLVPYITFCIRNAELHVSDSCYKTVSVLDAVPLLHFVLTFNSLNVSDTYEYSDNRVSVCCLIQVEKSCISHLVKYYS